MTLLVLEHLTARPPNFDDSNAATAAPERIKVFDAVRYHDMSSTETWLESSDRTFRYINSLLDHIKEEVKPDWIVIDGLEIYNQIAEMTMRYRNNLLPYQGVANMNLWKERRLYIRQLHYKALEIAKRGIIYTTYSEKDKVIVDGDVKHQSVGQTDSNIRLNININYVEI